MSIDFWIYILGNYAGITFLMGALGVLCALMFGLTFDPFGNRKDTVIVKSIRLVSFCGMFLVVMAILLPSREVVALHAIERFENEYTSAEVSNSEILTCKKEFIQSFYKIDWDVCYNEDLM